MNARSSSLTFENELQLWVNIILIINLVFKGNIMFTPVLKKIALFCISLAFFIPFITTGRPYVEGKQYTHISDKPVTILEI